MIVTTGKIIKVEVGPGRFRFERSAETPGLVVLHNLQNQTKVELPGNEEDASQLVKAYLRIVKEDIGYRKQECES